MKIKKPETDYRKLRFKNIRSDEFSHLLLLLYWPVYGLMFMFVERLYSPAEYSTVHCALDDLIPFCEIFIIPYLFWFVFLTGALLYTMFYDRDGFRRMMKYIIVTFTAAIAVYLIFPTRQNLRPASFDRENILTALTSFIYAADTPENVCPSLHVIGSLAACETILFSDKIRSRKIKAAAIITAVLICLSTVFLKQHSAIDTAAALPLCILGHVLFFRKKSKADKTEGKALRRTDKKQ